MIPNHVLQRSSTSNNDVSFHTTAAAAASPVRASSADSRVKVSQGRLISWPASCGT